MPWPTTRDLLVIFLFALLLRVVVFTGVTIRTHVDVEGYANLYDGHSYLITARALLGDRSEFNDYHGRVFIGFPAIVALLTRAGIPMSIAALGVNWIAAAAAAVMSAMLLGDRRIGWAMACLIPHYLMNSTMAMSEALSLALGVGGVLLATRRSAPIGGVMLGLAGLVRPMACFAALAGGVWLFTRKKRSSAIIFLSLASVVVGIGLFLVRMWRGDALANYAYQATGSGAYGGELITWPFHSLIITPFREHISVARIIYIYIHAFVAIGGCAILLARVKHRESRDVLCTPWLLSNTLFVLCLGSVWGFQCFHRFLVPALPALFWAYARFLPPQLIAWLAIAAGSAGLAILSA